jgi:hypothetical protein
MLKQSLLVSWVTATLLGGVAHAQQAPLQPSPIKRTPLGKVDVPGSNYEVVFGITELAGALCWHTWQRVNSGISSMASRKRFTRSANPSNYPIARYTTKERRATAPSR